MNGYVVKEDMHMWNKMCEYILFYTKDNTWKFKEYREKGEVSSKTIALEVLTKTGGLTGWYGNLETGLNFPTRERMDTITKHIGLKYDVVQNLEIKKHVIVFGIMISSKKIKNSYDPKTNRTT